ncbi:hypothetical protein Bealeia1_02038 (plasmid) [Candidatus Bealeia paramacronuclearis]|uniref:Uncharacterized protein n=1 Tax=Candidatus Bealeia paramacronuclearis TaxID=1921001 RepID=A0ABZ2C5U4_9PROT
MGSDHSTPVFPILWHRKQLLSQLKTVMHWSIFSETNSFQISKIPSLMRKPDIFEKAIPEWTCPRKTRLNKNESQRFRLWAVTLGVDTKKQISRAF